jgi:hypothetical protein
VGDDDSTFWKLQRSDYDHIPKDQNQEKLIFITKIHTMMWIFSNQTIEKKD